MSPKEGAPKIADANKDASLDQMKRFEEEEKSIVRDELLQFASERNPNNTHDKTLDELDTTNKDVEYFE